MTPELKDRAAALIRTCTDKGIMIATAESCTGGLVSGLLTEIAGSSRVPKWRSETWRIRVGTAESGRYWIAEIGRGGGLAPVGRLQ